MAILDAHYMVPSQTVFNQHKCLMFPELVVYQKSKQTYNTVCSDAPNYFKNI